jgi:hypothetical protein
VTRKLFALALWGMAAVLLPGHSPYKQWYAYRAKHLVVVTDETRPGAQEAANAVVAAIAARWPEARPVVAAARSSVEVVKLLASGQLQVGIVPAETAREAVEGRAAFAAIGKVPLRAVAMLGGDVLVVLEGCPPERARTIAQALAESRAAGPLARKDLLGANPPIPFHAAVLELWSGTRR